MPLEKTKVAFTPAVILAGTLSVSCYVNVTIARVAVSNSSTTQVRDSRFATDHLSLIGSFYLFPTTTFSLPVLCWVWMSSPVLFPRLNG
jgi:hypothetical protein